MTQLPPRALLLDDSSLLKRAQALSARLRLPITESADGNGLYLHLTKEYLEILFYERYPERPLRFHVDFIKGKTGYRVDLLRDEMLLRSVKLRKKSPQSIIDATGGLGRDAYLLAAGGSRVHVCERNPITAALLRDGLERAGQDKSTQAISARISLHVVDAVEFINGRDCTQSVIYLDPMFPPRRKSAMVKQELRILQLLEGSPCDEAPLAAAAWRAEPEKIVVKRPAKGPLLLDIPPSYSLKGKAVRFDVYLPKSLPVPGFLQEK